LQIELRIDLQEAKLSSIQWIKGEGLPLRKNKNSAQRYLGYFRFGIRRRKGWLVL